MLPVQGYGLLRKRVRHDAPLPLNHEPTPPRAALRKPHAKLQLRVRTGELTRRCGGGRCQNASWKQHKRNSCLPFEDRITRIRETVDTAIHEATDREDWRQVLSLGKQAEEDLAVAPDDWAMTVVLVNTSQANTILGNYDAAIAEWERLESYQMPPGMSDATGTSPRAMARPCRKALHPYALQP